MSGFSTPAAWWQEPRYVERGGELVFRHPYVAEGVRQYSFVLEADADCLDRFLARSFNEPLRRRFDYRSVGRHVLLNVVAINTMSPGGPDRLGHAGECEVALWVLAEDHNDEGSGPVWSVPYMFVNSPSALVSGREIHGFPKQLGDISIPPDSGQVPGSMSLRAPALKTFDPTTALEPAEVLTVGRTGPPAMLEPVWDSGPGPDQLTLGRALARRKGRRPDTLKRTLAEWRLLTALGEQFLRRSVPLLLLKQFRSVVDPDLACYQAVVSVELKMTAVRRLGLLPDDYTVTLSDVASQPFGRELGLAPTSNPKTAFWLDYDFALGGTNSVAQRDIR